MSKRCVKASDIYKSGIYKSLKVSSKCIAIVLTASKKAVELKLGGREILDDFKIRNKTCYWNPALVESINSLSYQGFVEPFTILVGGQELHLENLRTAWGRRVLKDPLHFTIQRIGNNCHFFILVQYLIFL